MSGASISAVDWILEENAERDDLVLLGINHGWLGRKAYNHKDPRPGGGSLRDKRAAR